MALIKCIECNHEVSEFAESCPNCGCPISISKNKKNANNIYSVILISCDERKVKIIQEVRKITGFDLAKAKKIVDNLSYVKTNCSLEEANQIKILLENKGASVDIVPYDPSQEKIIETKHIPQSPKVPKCPKCDSTAIEAVQRGYSILSGFRRSGEIMNYCKNCGHKWKPR